MPRLNSVRVRGDGPSAQRNQTSVLLPARKDVFSTSLPRSDSGTTAVAPLEAAVGVTLDRRTVVGRLQPEKIFGTARFSAM